MDFTSKATFYLWNGGKSWLKGSTKSQFVEILLHQSVDILRARCGSQEANDESKLTGLQDYCHSQAILNFCPQGSSGQDMF